MINEIAANPKSEETPETLRMEATGWRFFSGLFAEMPDDARIEKARAFFSAFGAQTGQESGEEIRADFLRLFVGPKKTLAPPWESVYLSPARLVFQENALAVRRAYLEASLTHDGIFKEPDDHISLELEFLAFLNERLATALDKGCVAEVEKARILRQRFLEEHLERWIGAFVADIAAHAKTTFWKNTARALSALFPPRENNGETCERGGRG